MGFHLIATQSWRNIEKKRSLCPGGEGVLEFDLDGGVQPKPRNPYPFLRVIFAKEGTHF